MTDFEGSLPALSRRIRFRPAAALLEDLGACALLAVAAALLWWLRIRVSPTASMSLQGAVVILAWGRFGVRGVLPVAVAALVPPLLSGFPPAFILPRVLFLAVFLFVRRPSPLLILAAAAYWTLAVVVALLLHGVAPTLTGVPPEAVGEAAVNGVLDVVLVWGLWTICAAFVLPAVGGGPLVRLARFCRAFPGPVSMTHVVWAVISAICAALLLAVAGFSSVRIIARADADDLARVESQAPALVHALEVVDGSTLAAVADPAREILEGAAAPAPPASGPWLLGRLFPAHWAVVDAGGRIRASSDDALTAARWVGTGCAGSDLVINSTAVVRRLRLTRPPWIALGCVVVRLDLASIPIAVRDASVEFQAAPQPGAASPLPSPAARTFAVDGAEGVVWIAPAPEGSTPRDVLRLSTVHARVWLRPKGDVMADVVLSRVGEFDYLGTRRLSWIFEIFVIFACVAFFFSQLVLHFSKPLRLLSPAAARAAESGASWPEWPSSGIVEFAAISRDLERATRVLRTGADDAAAFGADLEAAISASIPVLEVDGRGIVARVNEAALRMFPAAEGGSFVDLFEGRDRRNAESLLFQAAASGGHGDRALFLQRANDRPIELLASAFLRASSVDHAPRVIIVLRDRTAELESRLRLDAQISALGAVARLAARLALAPDARLKDVLTDELVRLAHGFSAARVSLFRRRDDGALVADWSWAAYDPVPGRATFPEALQEFADRDEPVVFPGVSLQSGAAAAAVGGTDAKAAILAPLRAAGRVSGLLEFFAPGTRREWRDLPNALLMVLGDVVGAALDRFDRVRRMAEDEARFEGLVEDAPVMIVRWRPDGRLLFVNAACAAYFGTVPSAMVDRTWFDFMDEEESRRLRRHPGEFSPASPIRRIELRLLAPSGPRVVAWTERAFFDAGGRVSEIQGIGLDVTDERETQLRLLQASKMAALGEMATGVAHEMNQPLTVIRVAARNLRRLLEAADAPSKAGLERVARIETQVDRAAAVVAHMRQFGRRGVAPAVVFDARDVVSGVVLSAEEALREAGISLDAALPASPLPSLGRPVQAEQVLLNLVVNARDAILTRRAQRSPPPRGEIRIRLSEAADAVEIAVEDDGGGVPPEVMPRLFEPFFTTKEPGRGMGLGLSLSFGMMRDMGGSLGAENGAAGAVFVMRLRKADPQASAG